MKWHSGPDFHRHTDIKRGLGLEIHVNAMLAIFVTFSDNKCQYAWI